MADVLLFRVVGFVCSCVVGSNVLASYDDRVSTDCDQVFVSSQRKSGSFSSPQFPDPYPVDSRCRFSFQGQDPERVQIMFIEFDLLQSTSTADDSDADRVGCEELDSIVIVVHIRGSVQDIGPFCGRKRPPMLMSPRAQMEVTFNSRGARSGRGFIANYSFVTDYGIKTGQRNISMGCGFVFWSNVSSNGTFTSPNFPGFYPRETECHYLFYGSESEYVYVTFPYFEVEGVSPGCLDSSMSDYVEFSNFNIELLDRKMSRYCGSQQDQAKRAVSSDGNFFRVTFRSNGVYDATGFEAFYQFRKIEDPYSSKPKSTSSSLQTGIYMYFIAFVAVIRAPHIGSFTPS